MLCWLWPPGAVAATVVMQDSLQNIPREDWGGCGGSSLTSLVAAGFCCVEHTSLLCMTTDLGKGQEGHLQFACIGWIVPTELAVSGRCVFTRDWSCLRVPCQFLSETDQPCGAAHQPMQWGVSGEPWYTWYSLSYPHPRCWGILVQMLLLLWLHFPTCAVQRAVLPSSVKHTEMKGWRVLYNCKVSLFTHALVGWKALYETQRMNYYYISFQLFITGIPPSSSPATSEALCPNGPWGMKGSRGWSSGLVSQPGRWLRVRLQAMWAQAVPSLPAMSLPPLALTTSACLLCRNTCRQGTLHGEREQSKPRHSTEWHQLVRSPPPLAKSPAKKAASRHEAPPRKPRSHGCLWPRRQHIMDPHSVLSIPATTPLLLQGTFFPLGFLLGGIFHPGFKNHTDQHRYFCLSDFKVQIFETGQWYGFYFFLIFFFSFEKLLWFCCYTKNRDLHCMVLDLFKFWWGKGVILE